MEYSSHLLQLELERVPLANAVARSFVSDRVVNELTSRVRLGLGPERGDPFIARERAAEWEQLITRSALLTYAILAEIRFGAFEYLLDRPRELLPPADMFTRLLRRQAAVGLIDSTEEWEPALGVSLHLSAGSPPDFWHLCRTSKGP